MSAFHASSHERALEDRLGICQYYAPSAGLIRSLQGPNYTDDDYWKKYAAIGITKSPPLQHYEM